MTDKSLHETLKDLGFDSRVPAPDIGAANGEREIFRMDNGETVAFFTAHAAWEWIKGNE